MSDWAFLLTPLLVLPIVLLFRFVGCGLDLTGQADPLVTSPDPKPPKPQPPGDGPVLIPEETPPGYKSTILLETSVIAYWRLVDDAAATTAEDARGFKDGEYKQNYSLPAAAGSHGRDPALLIPGQNSLIDSDPKVMCRFFDGGHVLVGFKPGLYTDQFTIEAWVRAEDFSPDFEYTLFDAGGRYALPPSAQADRGFRLFVNPQKRWQVRLGQSAVDLFAAPPLVPLGNRTHIALTAKDTSNIDVGSGVVLKELTLYVEGKKIATVSDIVYNRPDNAPLFIGIGNTQANPASTPVLRHPVLCRIQEVVLHNKALSEADIKNHVDIIK